MGEWPYPTAPTLPTQPLTTVACNDETNMYGAYYENQLGSSARVEVMGDLHVIVDVQTRSDLRGFGLSTALVRYVTEHDHHDLWLLVRSDNDPAITVYERNGFTRHSAPEGSALERWRVRAQREVDQAARRDLDAPVRILVLNRPATTRTR